MSKKSSPNTSPVKSTENKEVNDSESDPKHVQKTGDTDNDFKENSSTDTKKEKIEDAATKASKKEAAKVANKIDQNTTGLKTQAAKIKSLNEQGHKLRTSMDELTNRVDASEIVLQNVAENLEVIQQRVNNDTVNSAVGNLLEARIAQIEESLAEMKKKSTVYTIPRKSTNESEPSASAPANKSSVQGACPLCDAVHPLSDCRLFPTNLSRLQELRIRSLCRKCLAFKCDGKKNCPKATHECENCKGRQQPPASYHRKEVCLLDTWMMRKKNAGRDRKEDVPSSRAASMPESQTIAQQQQQVQQMPQQAVQPIVHQAAPQMYAPAYQAHGQPSVQFYQPAMQQGQQQPMFVLANTPNQQMQQQPPSQNYGQQLGYQQQGSFNQPGNGQYFRQYQ